MPIVDLTEEELISCDAATIESHELVDQGEVNIPQNETSKDELILFMLAEMNQLRAALTQKTDELNTTKAELNTVLGQKRKLEEQLEKTSGELKKAKQEGIVQAKLNVAIHSQRITSDESLRLKEEVDTLKKNCQSLKNSLHCTNSANSKLKKEKQLLQKELDKCTHQSYQNSSTLFNANGISFELLRPTEGFQTSLKNNNNSIK